MASPTYPLSFSEKEQKVLVEGLKDAGIRLQTPPSSTEELLNLLDKVERILSKIDQVPSWSVHDALQPCMKALTGSELLRHANTDVKVSIASCISEITRIMAPNTPFSDEEMKEYFQLSVMAVEKISYTSGSCYLKAVSVLKTLANIRVCVLMLDLELDELIIQMFQQFLDTNRSSQPDAVLSYMEKIMTLVIEESEEPSLELLSLLLTSVKRENQNFSPLAWELGQKVLKNCADKLKPDLPKAVRSMGIAYHDYAEVVASICQDTPERDFVETKELVPDAICLEVSPAVDDLPKSVMNNDTALTNKYDTRGNEKSLKALHYCQQIGTDSRSNSQLENIDAREEMTQELHPEAIQKKRGRRPNSLRKEEEGYDHSWIIGVSSSLKIPCRTKNPKKKNRNPSKSSAFEESASPSEPGKETQPHILSVRNVHGKSMIASPSQNHSLPDGIHLKLHQKKKIDSLMNQGSGLDLLSVSVGDLLRAQDEEKASQRAAATLRKESESTADAKAKRRRGLGNNTSESTGAAKAKRRRALGKNVSESTGDSKAKIRRGLLKNVPPSKTDGICSDLERKQDLSVWQIDAMEQKIGRNTPARHATEKPTTEKPADEIGYIEASKVKHERKCAPPKEEDHDEELVGCKIKVWWPIDKQFYEGVITAFDPERKKHKVEYIDGYEERLYLRAERWELVEDVEDGEATEGNKLGVNADAKAKRRRGLGNNASESTGDAKAKRRRALGKNVSESTGDFKAKVRRGLLKNVPPSKTDGICSDLERKQELSVWQIDAMEQKIGRNTPARHATEKPATEKPADEIGYIEASKVKHKRKCAPPKEEDHDEELVGCKIKVWWPIDEQFYEGVITAFDPERKKHKVEYIDGYEEILYLRAERWELVEDVEDSEATEGKKPGVNASTNWFCNAKVGSSGPAKTNYKASSCKRTKCRILRAEKGEKSLAEILSVSAEPQCTSQVANACGGTVDVHGYKVKASTAPLLRAIFAKHGDIAARCLYKSAAVRASLLEVVCDIVKRLQRSTIEAIIYELQAIENEVSDAEAAKLQVSWLQEYLKKIREVEEVGQRSLLLKEMRANTILVTEAAKRDLEEKQLELVAAQERLREAERCVKALACVAEKIGNDILDCEAKESSWRKLLDELR